MIRAVTAIVLAGGLALAEAVGPARGQADPEGDAKMAAELAQSHGLPAAADLAAAHRNMVRIFLSDGSGHDLPALVYGWTPDEGLTLDVWAAHETVGDLRVLHRRLDAARGRELVALRALLRRSPIPAPDDPPPDKSGLFTVCIHAVGIAVESIEDGRVERRIRDACHVDALTDRTLRLSLTAIDLFPECDGLTASHYRSDRHRLEDCMRLHGDVGAAVAVRNRLERLKWPEERAKDRHLGDLFSPGATLAWADGPASAGQAPAAVAAGMPDVLWADRIVASGDKVTVEGRARHFSTEDDPGSFEAAFVQAWVRKGGRWRMTSWTMGAHAGQD